MKGKHLFILLLLALAVGGAWYLLQTNDAEAGRKSGDGAGSKVLSFPINDVARVTVKATGAELNLVKKGDDWVVQERADYPASYEQISDLIRKLWDLKTVQEVKVGPSQFPRLDLVEPGKEGGAGTVAELKDKDGKTLATLLLGKKFMRKGDGMGMGMPGENPGFPAGRYVAPVGATKVSLVSETLDDVDPKAERWLKKDFFKIENPKSIKVDGATEPMHWTVTRENATDAWRLADAKPDEQPLDTAKVSTFATMFSFASFADVLAPDAKPEDTGLDKPTTVTIETFDKFTYTLKIGKPNGENLPVTMTVAADPAKTREPGKDEKPEDKEKLDKEFQANLKKLEDKLAAEKKFEARPYLIAKATLDPLLKDRAAVLAEKKPETPPPTTGAPGVPPPSVPLPADAPPGAPGKMREPITVTTPPVSAPPLPPGFVPPPTPGSAPVPVPPLKPAPEKPAPDAPEKPAPDAPPAKPAPEKPASEAAPAPANPAPAQPAKPAAEEPAPKPPEKKGE